MSQSYVAGAAAATTLSSGLNNSDTSFSVVAATGWPASTPFVIAIDRGTATEEKILVTGRTGTSITACTRGYDGTAAIAHSVGTDNVEHVLSAVQIQELIDFANTPVPTASIADTAVTPAKMSSKTLRIPHTFTVPGDLAVPSGQDDVIPGFFVPVPATQTAKLVAARHKIGAGTSATVKLQQNGVDATGFTAISATTTATTTNPADVTLADDDYLQLIVTAISGAPQNLSFTLWIEYTLA